MPTSIFAYIELEEIKSFLKIENTSEDDQILEELIDSVSLKFDRILERTIRKTTYTDEKYNGNGLRDFDVPNYPIVTISEITEDDVTLTEDVDYYLYSEEGYLKKVGSDSVWTSNPKGIKISYIAGYDIGDIPQDLKQALKVQVSHEFQKRSTSSWGESARSFPDGSINYQTGDILESVEKVLRLHLKTV